MRNRINIVPSTPIDVNVNSLEVGAMFRYRIGADTVYMKVMQNSQHGVVDLTTGTLYSDYNQKSSIDVVHAVNISAP
jgi:hypothetical protein